MTAREAGEVEKITIGRPDDFHVHFRGPEMFGRVIPFTTEQFSRAMVMPNTNPPILTAENASRYYEQIRNFVISPACRSCFEPLMTIQITDETTPEIVHEANKLRFVVAGKVYPKGVTTNSHNGVSNFKKLYPVFAEMEKADLALSLHGQVPDSFCLDREKDFLETLIQLAKDFQGLRIVMEHVSTKESVQAVKDLPSNVAATITAHHLLLTLDDVLSSVGENGSQGLNPHHYCQPVLQRPEDRLALREAAVSGNPKFFFGSDTAPHLRERKESSCGCAGVFSAPVALSVLAEFFSTYSSKCNLNALSAFSPFVSEFGARFYCLKQNFGKITLEKKSWTVPNNYGGIVPFYAGRELNWRVVKK